MPFSRRVASGYDAAAVAGIAAVEATGASLTVAQKDAANTFIVGMKAQGIWTGTDCLWMILGGTAAAHAVNWRQPGTYNMTWVNSPTHSANGVQYGGTAYGRTGYNPNTVGVDATNAGMLCYVNAVGSGFRPLLAAQSDISTREMVMALLTEPGNELIYAQGLYSARTATFPSSASNATLVGQRNASTDHRRFISGTKTAETTGAAGATSVALEIYAGCYNTDVGPVLYSNHRAALLGIYRGAWSDAQQTAFASLVTAYQTALSRA